jgi:hypothetical protein
VEHDEFARTMVLAKSDLAASGVHTSPRSGNGGPEPARAVPGVASARIQVLSGTFAGREVALNKALTTMGQPGVQVVAITRRGDGYHLVAMESAANRGPPRVNGEPLGPQARKLNANDVIELVGIKMGFFVD